MSKNDFIRTVFVDAVPAAVATIAEHLSSLRAEAESWLRDQQGFTGPARTALSADMRYHGQ